jgi:hypothetical protein
VRRKKHKYLTVPPHKWQFQLEIPVIVIGLSHWALGADDWGVLKDLDEGDGERKKAPTPELITS